MPDYRVMFDRNYIGHVDLGGRDVTLTIKKVVGGELTAEGGRKSRKPVAHFAGDSKPFIVNKTNAKTIASLYGDETDKWSGKRITLFTSTTRNPDGGGMTACIRIRPKVPSAGNDTALAKQPAPEEHIVPSPTEPSPPQPSPRQDSPLDGVAGGDGPTADEALLIKAGEFANCGTEKYAAWWQGLTAAQRKAIGADKHAEFKDIAAKS